MFYIIKSMITNREQTMFTWGPELSQDLFIAIILTYKK